MSKSEPKTLARSVCTGNRFQPHFEATLTAANCWSRRLNFAPASAASGQRIRGAGAREGNRPQRLGIYGVEGSCRILPKHSCDALFCLGSKELNPLVTIRFDY